MIDAMDVTGALADRQIGPIVEADAGIDGDLARIIEDKTAGDAQAALFYAGMQSMLESLGQLGPEMEGFLRDLMDDPGELPPLSPGPGHAGESGPEWDHPIYDSREPGTYEPPIYDGSPGYYRPLTE